MYMELDYRDNILLRCIVKHSVIRQCILVNYSMLMRSIHDFIALTKNNNIDLRLRSILLFLVSVIKSCIDLINML